MKKSTLLLIPALLGILLGGCNKNDPTTIDDDGPVCTGDTCENPKALSVNYKAPFYLKVGETVTLQVDPSPVEHVAPEKLLFSWEITSGKNNCDISVIEGDSLKTRKCTVTGKKAGMSIIKTTNTYDTSLNKTFTIYIVDLADGDYLYQYPGNTGDKKILGYDKDEYPNGKLDGTTDLNGISWDYERNRIVYLANSSQALQIGKGCKPENNEYENAEDLTLKSKNTKKIKQINVETASADSLCDFTIKIGGITYLSTKAPKRNDSACTILTTGVIANGAQGDIELKWDNPEYDAECANPESDKFISQYYKGPGAIYFKSIYIQYEE